MKGIVLSFSAILLLICFHLPPSIYRIKPIHKLQINLENIQSFGKLDRKMACRTLVGPYDEGGELDSHAVCNRDKILNKNT